MMNSFRRNNKSVSQLRLLAAMTVLAIVFGATDMFTDGAVRSTLRPVFTGTAAVAQSAWRSLFGGSWLSSRDSLVEKNRDLIAEIEMLKAQGAAYEALRRENESLRALANLISVEGGSTTTTGISAPILSSFRASPYGTFLIGAGATHGVARGDIAVVAGGFVAGSVTDVSTGSSVVRSILAPGVSTEVVADGIGFTIEGRGAGNGRAQVPRESQIQDGDPLFAPTLGNRLVGVIGKIESATSSAYSQVYVHLPVNLNMLRHVYIVPRR